MPTNANTFNSRVTSEALEAKYRQVFPAQGGAELVQDLFASGVIQPVVDFSTVAEGSVLPQNLQTAWDYSTGTALVSSGTNTHINNTGFWKLDWTASGIVSNTGQSADIEIFDGAIGKPIWQWAAPSTGGNAYNQVAQETVVVFLRAGDSLITSFSAPNAVEINLNWRQIADVNGNLVNPLGFVFS